MASSMFEDRFVYRPVSPKPRRFLFLFSDTGGGHRASAMAVTKEMERLYGDAASVEMIDVFVEMGRWPFNQLPRWYPSMVGLNGIPWSFGFRLSNRVRWIETMSYLVWPYAGQSLCEVLKRYPTDVVVSFHSVPNYALALALQTMELTKPLAVVALDMVTLHASWFAPGANLYCVPTEAAKTLGVRLGVDPQRIKVTGMPARRSFVEAMHLSKADARAALNLPLDRPVVLLVGGGDGLGPLGRVVRELISRAPRAHLVVITGRNRELYDLLRQMDAPVPLQVEGFVSNMEIWMRAADLLVTKAGPNTLVEAFISGLPIVLYTALPGQETGNITHVEDNQAGLWAPRPDEAADAVVGLINDLDRRNKMAARSLALARPQAAERIARNLWNLGDLPVESTKDIDMPRRPILERLVLGN